MKKNKSNYNKTDYIYSKQCRGQLIKVLQFLNKIKTKKLFYFSIQKSIKFVLVQIKLKYILSLRAENLHKQKMYVATKRSDLNSLCSYSEKK